MPPPPRHVAPAAVPAAVPEAELPEGVAADIVVYNGTNARGQKACMFTGPVFSREKFSMGGGVPTDHMEEKSLRGAVWFAQHIRLPADFTMAQVQQIAIDSGIRFNFLAAAAGQNMWLVAKAGTGCEKGTEKNLRVPAGAVVRKYAFVREGGIACKLISTVEALTSTATWLHGTFSVRELGDDEVMLTFDEVCKVVGRYDLKSWIRAQAGAKRAAQLNKPTPLTAAIKCMSTEIGAYLECRWKVIT